MMSHLVSGKQANCVRSRASGGGTFITEITRHHQVPDPRRMSLEDYCAVHLATITESAVESLDGEMSYPVNYRDLPEIFYQEILPLLGVELDEEDIERIQQISGQYSKGRGKQAHEFTGDSEQKENDASQAVRTAAETFLKDSYDILEAAAERRKELFKEMKRD
jgi:hypothetical protein